MSDICTSPHREIAGRKLILETRLAKDLCEFVGGLSQEGLQFWKTVFSAMTHPGHSPSRGSDSSNLTKDQKKQSSPSPSGQKVILLPCKSAPSWERVQLWLQARRQFECLQRDRKRRIGAQNVMSIQDKNKSPPHEELESFLPLSQRQDEASEKVSASQTLRKNTLTLPLSMSPVEAGTSNSPNEIKYSMEPEIRVQEERDENSFKHTPSPDPSCLPPWQQPSNSIDLDKKKLELGVGLTSPKLASSIDPLSPESIKPKQFLSPSPFPIKDQDGERLSPSLLHSTPILSKRRSRGVRELDCSPGSEGRHF